MALWGRVLPRLGLRNVLRVALYRVGIRTGLHPARWQRGSIPKGLFFGQSGLPPVPFPAVTTWDGTATLFGRWMISHSDAPPDWFSDLRTGSRMREPHRPWWEIPDFDPEVGDIKCIWEMSRMDWVIAFAQRARQGDARALEQLNSWLSAWCEHNPPYRGPNWKCGQEASIRVMHLATAALILRQETAPLPGLSDLIHQHLKRIVPTLQYAVAQDNNHGTSEAAALFIGGSWLAATGAPEGSGWELKGRRLLEERVSRLIGRHGTFSQYSLNYQRLLLDTLSLAEVWRRALDLREFSSRWNERAAAAARWLYRMVSPVRGDGPNVGGNDGARLLSLADTDYRDYRGSIQLATALFTQERSYPENGPWNHGLGWLGVSVPDRAAPAPSSYCADDGGFAVLRRGAAMALFRYPELRFRPAHADLLHLDLWIGGTNLLRDGGSFSYHTEERWIRYFAGTESHNTVQFDDREQMPRLGRFLFGDWPEPTGVQPLTEDESTSSIGAGYRDRWGAGHTRHLHLTGQSVRVVDHVAGFSIKAVLRWRLVPGPWALSRLSPRTVRASQAGADGMVVEVKSSVPFRRAEIVEGWESRYYSERTSLPVLEVEVPEAAVLTTGVTWGS
jgi:hypothetical protein